MLFPTPLMSSADKVALERIDEQRRQLRIYVAEPRRWVGRLRRTSLARAIQGSNGIEGYAVGLDDAIAAVDLDEPLHADQETWRAITGYRDAMTYVLRLSTDPHFALNETLLRGLHFMMTSFDLKKNPGTWRPGQIFVRDDSAGAVAYEGPGAQMVPALMAELVVSVDEPGHPPLVRAAMAHLNLVMIHPFSDGNGRMACCLQTLVLAREGILAPQFASIEEYLGANTPAYYAVLAQVGQGRWRPEGDAAPWLRFMLTAHYRQHATLLRRVRESSALWSMLEELVAAAGAPPRAGAALFDAASGRRLRRGSYLASLEEPVSEAVATRDLRQLVDRGLLESHGEKRGRFYTRTARLAEVHARSRSTVRSGDVDPYAAAAEPTLF